MWRRPATGHAPAPTPSGRPRRSSRSGLFPSAGLAQPAGTASENLPPRRRAPGFHSPFNLSEWLYKPFRPLRSIPPQGFPCPDLFRTRPLSRLRAAPLPYPMSALLLRAAFLPFPMGALLLPAVFLPFPMAPLLLPVAFLPFPVTPLPELTARLRYPMALLLLPVAFLPLPVTPLPEPVAHLRPNPGPDPKPGQHPDPGPGPAPKPGRAPVPKPRRLPGPGLRADPIPNSSPRNRRPKRLRRFPSRLQLCLPPLLRLPLWRLRPRHHPLLRRRLLLPPCRPLPRLPLRRP